MRTIYYGGKVYTGQLPLQEAFIVEDGRFSFAGTSDEALSAKTAGDSQIDLNGAFVCAGFNDSHMHLLGLGESLSSARLDQHTSSLAELITCMQQFAAVRGPSRGWIFGRGWNQDCFCGENRMPNRWDLDKVSTELPVCAVRTCGHALAVNSRALDLLGITASTPQPEGGRIGMEGAEPNGLFFDAAMELIYSAIPLPTKDETKAMLRTACRALNTFGVTSCQSDDYCVFPALSWQTVNEAFRELEQAGELSVRVYEQCNFTNLPALQTFYQAGNRTGTGTDRFRIGPLKMLGDGALGARTAFLSRPYADAPETCGIPVFSQDTFDEMIGFANAHGMQVAVHAIGDACLDRVLSALTMALDETPRVDHRHGIVHCQITRPEQLQKIAEMNLHVYAQSIFLDYDISILESRVGSDLAKTSYCWNTLRKTGATVSNGTDCPVELPFALGGIQCAVTRTNLAGTQPAHLPDEAFTVQQALDSYTAWGAYASFEESVKGRIEPGMLADFVVLGADPFAVPTSEIKDIPIFATYLGGEMVYCKV